MTYETKIKQAKQEEIFLYKPNQLNNQASEERIQMWEVWSE